MPNRKKIEYSQLEKGYEFPPSRYQLDSSTIATYHRAVEETDSLYQDTELVPPMAIATFAMAALSECMLLPSGAIHVAQELEFIDTVRKEDVITCHAKVSRKQERGGLRLLTIDLNVFDQEQKAVLAGKTSFILPKHDRAK